MLKQVKDMERTQIVERYWQLARLGAEDTKGNIMGQIKALEAISELTLKPAEPARAGRTAAPQIYRAAWRTDDPEDGLPQ